MKCSGRIQKHTSKKLKESHLLRSIREKCTSSVYEMPGFLSLEDRLNSDSSNIFFGLGLGWHFCKIKKASKYSNASASHKFKIVFYVTSLTKLT